MRWGVLGVAMLLAACNSPGGRADTEFIIGPRVDLRPGQSLELPLVLEASGEGDVELTVITDVVSHGPALETLPTIDLLPPHGEVTKDPDNPLSVGCVGDCRGEHTVMLSLPEVAVAPVTVGLAYDAKLEGSGLVLDPGQSPASTAWVIPNSDLYARRWDDVTSGRLFVTSSVEPAGDLRLEVPTSHVTGPPRVVLVGDSSSVSEVAAGTAHVLAPPIGACHDMSCDWSLEVSTVVPWQVTSTSNEFAVSFSSDEALISGEGTWTGGLTAESTQDLRLEVVVPPGQGTSVRLTVRAVFPSQAYQGPEPSVLIRIGGEEIAHRQAWVHSSVMFVPLDCNSSACTGSLPVTIDVETLFEDVSLELQMHAVQARSDPVAGEIEVEILP